MIVVDARDKEINVGDHVRYVDTGTVGEVIELKVEDETAWVRIEKTGLWYRNDLVEILDEKDLKQKSNDKDNGELDIEAIKNSSLNLENVEISSHVADGGG